MSAQSAIQGAIGILKNSADSRVECVSICGVADWESEPTAKALYDKEIAAISGLESVAARVAAFEAESAELRKASEVAHARSLQQAQIIATLANQKAELELQLAAPRGTDAQILKERALTAEMISGCIGYGYNGDDYPPDSAAWLRPFYAIGAKVAELELQLATEVERLDFVLNEELVIYEFKQKFRLNDVMGETPFPGRFETPRAAIDAAIEFSKGGE